MQSGDGVLVCDCGGGTVDITTYLIQTVHPKLEFEELCTGIGGKCGSTAVDRNFYMLMKARFGKAFDSLPRRRTGPENEFMNKFERDFGLGTEDGAVHHLPLNMPLQKADPDDDLQGLFEPVVSKILNLVRQQVEYANEQAARSVINRIILVGGFGDSYYLRKAFLNVFANAGNIRVTTPDNAQRLSKGRPYRPGGAFCEKQAVPTTLWIHVRRAEALSPPHDLGDQKGISMPTPSAYQGTDYDLFQDVRKVGDINVDFRNVNLSVFKAKQVSGRLVYKLDYSLNVIFGAQESVLKFEARANGQVIGKTSVDFARPLFY
ncbi:hypothetical protein BJX62DRAFT_245151 [Aspergillus germanicus]